MEKLTQEAFRIKRARKIKGITQEELAEKLGVTRQVISHWERGTRIPKTKTLERIADALDLDYKELVPEYSRGLDSLFQDQIPLLVSNWEDITNIEPIVMQYFLKRMHADSIETVKDNGATIFRFHESDEMLTYLEREELLNKLSNYFDALVRDCIFKHKNGMNDGE